MPLASHGQAGREKPGTTVLGLHLNHLHYKSSFIKKSNLHFWDFSICNAAFCWIEQIQKSSRCLTCLWTEKKKKGGGSKWKHKEKLPVTTKCPARERLVNTVIEVHVSVSRSFLSLQWLRSGKKKGEEVLQKGIPLQKQQLVWANQKMLAQPQRQSLTHHSEWRNPIPLWPPWHRPFDSTSELQHFLRLGPRAIISVL